MEDYKENKGLEEKMLRNKLSMIEHEQKRIDDIVAQYKNIYDKISQGVCINEDMKTRHKIAAQLQQNYILKTHMDYFDDHFVEINVHLSDIESGISKI
tara:strand:+ start:2864 stop:3157 length:294 start_codon:yes stop_codon:yes gene_type:complete